jgi:hypothetical protein
VKRFLAIGFIFLLSAQCIFKLSIITYFEANREYIAEVLCINKEEPMTVCHGQCFLDRNLSLVEEQSTQEPANVKLQIETIVFVSHSSDIEFSNRITEIEKTDSPPRSYQSSDRNSLFHPPRG